MPLYDPDNKQLYTELASRLWFQQDPTETRNFRLLELGDLREVASPTTATESESLRIPARCNAEVYRTTTNPTESWACKTVDFGMNNWSHILLGEEPTRVQQAAGTSTAVLHENCVGGGLVKIKNADGTGAYRLTAVTTVGGLTEGTDYEVVSLESGFIRLLDGGSIALGTAQDLAITFESEEAVLLQIAPQTSTSKIGVFYLGMQTPCGEHKWMRDARGILEPAGNNFSSTSASDADFTMSVLGDTRNPENPAGLFTKYLGQMV